MGRDFILLTLNDGNQRRIPASFWESLTAALERGRVWWEAEDLYGDPIILDLQNGLWMAERRSATNEAARRAEEMTR